MNYSLVEIIEDLGYYTYVYRTEDNRYYEYSFEMIPEFIHRLPLKVGDFVFLDNITIDWSYQVDEYYR